ncbi:DUF1573 domain-containing protein [Deferrisoma sp.]
MLASEGSAKGQQVFLLGLPDRTCGTGSTRPAGPRTAGSLFFPEAEADGGIVGPGAEVTHRFPFENRGEQTIRILATETPCWCTVGDVVGAEVPPGGRGEILVSFRAGEVERRERASVIVTYAEGEAVRRAELGLSARVARGVVLEPEGIDFGCVRQGHPAARTVRVLRLSGPPLVVRRVEVTAPFLRAEASPWRRGKVTGVLIGISVGHEAPRGEFLEVVTVHTDRPDRPRIDIPVWGNVVPATGDARCQETARSCGRGE